MPTRRMVITAARGFWVVRADGAVIGETSRAMELTQGSAVPVIYFPREDVGMAFLERSETTSRSRHMGEATHYDIVARSGPIHDAAWSYEDPKAEAERIRGMIAFDPDQATVEQV